MPITKNHPYYGQQPQQQTLKRCAWSKLNGHSSSSIPLRTVFVCLWSTIRLLTFSCPGDSRDIFWLNPNSHLPFAAYPFTVNMPFACWTPAFAVHSAQGVITVCWFPDFILFYCLILGKLWGRFRLCQPNIVSSNPPVSGRNWTKSLVNCMPASLLY